MLLGTLDTDLLENLLRGKEVMRTGEGVIATSQGRGT